MNAMQTGKRVALMYGAGFEERARAAKVAKIVALVPVDRICWSARQVGKVADRMAAFTQNDRDRWAAAAGASSPSEATWMLAVAALRARRPGRVAARAVG